MKDKKWYHDNYHDGDEDSIVNLIQEDIQNRGSQAIFNKEFWRWKYKKNNAGFSKSWIKLAKSKVDHFIGGHYTVIPVYLNNNAGKFLSAQSVDTLTHISFRKQGVFTKLADLCYRELDKDNVDVVYGYPNDNSYPGFINKLGWKKLFVVHELCYILDVPKLVNYKFKNGYKNLIIKLGLRLYYNILQLFYKFVNNNNIRCEEIKIGDIDSQIMNKLISNKYVYFIDRSKEYLKWRYTDNPVDKELIIKKIIYKNETVGYYIVKIKTYPHRENIKIAHIMELILNQEIKNIYPTVFNDILKESKNEKATMIYAYSHKKQYDFMQYKRYGFIKIDNKNFIIKIIKNDDRYIGIYDSHNWFISQGDSDRA